MADTAFGRWNYTFDSSNDSVGRINGQDRVGGTVYEIHGIAIKETEDKIFIALNTNLPLAGTSSETANDNYVRWGDAILNFTGNDLTAANNSSELFAVRFAENNESGVPEAGVYQDVSVQSVATQNGLLLENLGSYIEYVNNPAKGGAPGNHSFGALPDATNYFDPGQHIPNVIAAGLSTGVGVVSLDAAQLVNEGLDFGNSPGQFTYGFSFDKAALPSGNFILHLAPECANDIITVTGTLGSPKLEVIKRVNGVDSNTPETAIGVFPGSDVEYTFEVRNTGGAGVHLDDLQLVDDRIPFNFRDLNWSGDIDGNSILTNDEVWTFTVQAPAENQSVTIDFDTDPVTGQPLARGTSVTDLYKAEYGLTISTRINRDSNSTVVATDQGTMIFDSANPTGGDTDLRTPGYGQDNNAALGNVLILSEDGNANNPNDNRFGGVFEFQWDGPIQIRSIGVLDIENPGSHVILYRNGVQVGEIVSLEALGDNSYQTVNLGNVIIDRMEIVLSSPSGIASGAIASLDFTSFHQNNVTVGTIWNPEMGSDPAFYTAPNPDIAIKKLIRNPNTGVWEDADTQETSLMLTPGSPATFSYVITNTGNMPFKESDLTLRDDQIGDITSENLVSKGNGDGILEPGEAWEYQFTAPVNNLQRSIDFERDAAGNNLQRGTVIDDEYSDWGLNISRVRSRQQNGAMIFDSSSPTGDDYDLASDTLGNILILSEDGNSINPDDDARGGTFRFDFDDLVRVHQVGVFDIDENSRGSGGSIATFGANGQLLGRYNILDVGDNTFQSIAIGDELVKRMEITLIGSGAITGLDYEQSYRNIGSVNVQTPYNVVASDPVFVNTLGSSHALG